MTKALYLLAVIGIASIVAGAMDTLFGLPGDLVEHSAAALALLAALPRLAR